MKQSKYEGHPAPLAPLERFILESNRIEGIVVTDMAVERPAYEAFLHVHAGMMTVAHLESLVSVVQPRAMLRDQYGLDVRVGDHVPHPGGPYIRQRLESLLDWAQRDGRYGAHLAYETHQEYETLHPFTDGNGRSGRALWLWQHCQNGSQARALELGFLHTWYYESLREGRA